MKMFSADIILSPCSIAKEELFVDGGAAWALSVWDGNPFIQFQWQKKENPVGSYEHEGMLLMKFNHIS